MGTCFLSRKLAKDLARAECSRKSLFFVHQQLADQSHADTTDEENRIKQERLMKLEHPLYNHPSIRKNLHGHERLMFALNPYHLALTCRAQVP